MKKGIEIIKKEEEVLAVIIYSDYQLETTEFFSPQHFPQQLGFIFKKQGEIIKAHTHCPVKREINLTQEVLVIRKGRVKLRFFDKDKKYFDSRILERGDVILVAGGGHSYDALEDLEMIEVKQGPYLGKGDKIIFEDI